MADDRVTVEILGDASNAIGALAQFRAALKQTADEGASESDRLKNALDNIGSGTAGAGGIQNLASGISSALSGLLSATQSIMSGVASAVSKAVDLAMASLDKLMAGFQKAREIAGVVGVIGTAFLGASINVASGLEEQEKKIQGLALGAGESIQTVNAQLLDLATKVPVPLNQLADAYYHVRSAGVSVADAEFVLQQSAMAATAGHSELTPVLNTVVGAMNAYNVNLKDSATTQAEAVHFTDVMTKAVQQSNVEYRNFADSLGRVLPMSHALGLSVESAAANMAVLTHAGLNADEAATQLSAVLNQLVQQPKQGQQAMAELGITYDQVLQTIRGPEGLVGGFRMIDDALKAHTTTAEEYDTTLHHIFPNLRAIRDFMTAWASQNVKFEDIFGNINNSAGVTVQAFQVAITGLRVGIEQLKNDMRVIFDMFGAPLLAPFEAAVAKVNEGLQALIHTFEAHPDWAGEAAHVVALATAFLMLFGGLTAVQGAFALLGTKIGGTFIGIRQISDGIVGILTPLSLVGAAVLAFSQAWDNNWGGMRDKLEQLGFKPILTDITTALSGLGHAAQQALHGDFEGALNTAKQALSQFFDLFGSKDSPLPNFGGKLRDAIEGLIRDIADAIVTHLPDLARAGEQIVQSLGQGLQTALPAVLHWAEMVVSQLATFFGEHGEEWGHAIGDALGRAGTFILAGASALVADLTGWLITNGGPKLIEAGLALAKGLVKGLLDGLDAGIHELPGKFEGLGRVLEAIGLAAAGAWAGLKLFTGADTLFTNLATSVRAAGAAFQLWSPAATALEQTATQISANEQAMAALETQIAAMTFARAEETAGILENDAALAGEVAERDAARASAAGYMALFEQENARLTEQVALEGEADAAAARALADELGYQGAMQAAWGETIATQLEAEAVLLRMPVAEAQVAAGAATAAAGAEEITAEFSATEAAGLGVQANLAGLQADAAALQLQMAALLEEMLAAEETLGADAVGATGLGAALAAAAAGAKALGAALLEFLLTPAGIIVALAALGAALMVANDQWGIFDTAAQRASRSLKQEFAADLGGVTDKFDRLQIAARDANKTLNEAQTQYDQAASGLKNFASSQNGALNAVESFFQSGVSRDFNDLHQKADAATTSMRAAFQLLKDEGANSAQALAELGVQWDQLSQKQQQAFEKVYGYKDYLDAKQHIGMLQAIDDQKAYAEAAAAQRKEEAAAFDAQNQTVITGVQHTTDLIQKQADTAKLTGDQIQRVYGDQLKSSLADLATEFGNVNTRMSQINPKSDEFKSLTADSKALGKEIGDETTKLLSMGLTAEQTRTLLAGAFTNLPMDQFQQAMGIVETNLQQAKKDADIKGQVSLVTGDINTGAYDTAVKEVKDKLTELSDAADTAKAHLEAAFSNDPEVQGLLDNIALAQLKLAEMDKQQIDHPGTVDDKDIKDQEQSISLAQKQLQLYQQAPAALERYAQDVVEGRKTQEEANKALGEFFASFPEKQPLFNELVTKEQQLYQTTGQVAQVYGEKATPAVQAFARMLADGVPVQQAFNTANVQSGGALQNVLPLLDQNRSALAGVWGISEQATAGLHSLNGTYQEGTSLVGQLSNGTLVFLGGLQQVNGKVGEAGQVFQVTDGQTQGWAKNLGVATAAADILAQRTDAAGTTLDKTSGALANVSRASSNVPNVMGPAGVSIADVAKFAQESADATNKAAQGTNTLSTSTEQGTGHFLTYTKHVDDANQATSQVGEKAQTAAGQADSAFSQIGSSAQAKLGTDVPKAADDAGKGLSDGLTTQIQAANVRIGVAIGTLVMQIDTALRTGLSADKGRAAAQQLGDGLDAGLTAAGVRALFAVAAMINQIVAALQAGGAAMYNAAFNSGFLAGQGLAAGIDAGADLAAAAAGRLAAIAAQAAATKFEQASPSKVFMRMGANNAVGLALGFTSSIPDTRAAYMGGLDQISGDGQDWGQQTQAATYGVGAAAVTAIGQGAQAAAEPAAQAAADALSKITSAFKGALDFLSQLAGADLPSDIDASLAAFTPHLAAIEEQFAPFGDMGDQTATHLGTVADSLTKQVAPFKAVVDFLTSLNTLLDQADSLDALTDPDVLDKITAALDTLNQSFAPFGDMADQTATHLGNVADALTKILGPFKAVVDLLQAMNSADSLSLQPGDADALAQALQDFLFSFDAAVTAILDSDITRKIIQDDAALSEAFVKIIGAYKDIVDLLKNVNDLGRGINYDQNAAQQLGQAIQEFFFSFDDAVTAILFSDVTKKIIQGDATLADAFDKIIGAYKNIIDLLKSVSDLGRGINYDPSAAQQLGQAIQAFFFSFDDAVTAILFSDVTKNIISQDANIAESIGKIISTMKSAADLLKSFQDTSFRPIDENQFKQFAFSLSQLLQDWDDYITNGWMPHIDDILRPATEIAPKISAIIEPIKNALDLLKAFQDSHVKAIDPRQMQQVAFDVSQALQAWDDYIVRGWLPHIDDMLRPAEEVSQRLGAVLSAIKAALDLLKDFEGAYLKVDPAKYTQLAFGISQAIQAFQKGVLAAFPPGSLDEAANISEPLSKVLAGLKDGFDLLKNFETDPNVGAFDPADIDGMITRLRQVLVRFQTDLPTIAAALQGADVDFTDSLSKTLAGLKAAFDLLKGFLPDAHFEDITTDQLDRFASGIVNAIRAFAARIPDINREGLAVGAELSQSMQSVFQALGGALSLVSSLDKDSASAPAPGGLKLLSKDGVKAQIDRLLDALIEGIQYLASSAAVRIPRETQSSIDDVSKVMGSVMQALSAGLSAFSAVNDLNGKMPNPQGSATVFPAAVRLAMQAEDYIDALVRVIKHVVEVMKSVTHQDALVAAQFASIVQTIFGAVNTSASAVNAAMGKTGSSPTAPSTTSTSSPSSTSSFSSGTLPQWMQAAGAANNPNWPGMDWNGTHYLWNRETGDYLNPQTGHTMVEDQKAWYDAARQKQQDALKAALDKQKSAAASAPTATATLPTTSAASLPNGVGNLGQGVWDSFATAMAGLGSSVTGIGRNAYPAQSPLLGPNFTPTAAAGSLNVNVNVNVNGYMTQADAQNFARVVGPAIRDQLYNGQVGAAPF